MLNTKARSTVCVGFSSGLQLEDLICKHSRLLFRLCSNHVINRRIAHSSFGTGISRSALLSSFETVAARLQEAFLQEDTPSLSARPQPLSPTVGLMATPFTSITCFKHLNECRDTMRYISNIQSDAGTI